MNFTTLRITHTLQISAADGCSLTAACNSCENVKISVSLICFSQSLLLQPESLYLVLKTEMDTTQILLA